MEIRRVLHSMRHQVAAIRQLARESMQPHTLGRARQERTDRRRPREELHIHGGVDASLAKLSKHAEKVEHTRQHVSIANRQHIFWRHEAHDIENGAVALEHAEVDVMASYHRHRAIDRIARQHRGAVLDELEEDDRGRGVERTVASDPAPQRQQETERNTNPVVDATDRGRPHRSAFPSRRHWRTLWASVPDQKYVAIFPAGHPASQRCSSFKYRQYSQSSRLAIRAPRPENLATHF